MANIVFGSVSMTQTGFDRFTVQYGLQVTKNLNYGEAGKEFGLCVMHESACESRIDNRSREEAREAGDKKPYFKVNHA